MSSTRQYQKICEWCGRGFIAQKATTLYCSHTCSSRAYKAKKRGEQQSAVEAETIAKQAKREYGDLDEKPYLTPSQTAKVLGVSRATIYRYLGNGELKSLQFSGKTLIRRADIDQAFDNATEYKARPRETNAVITDFYTLKELEQLYAIGESWAHRLIKDNKIPKVLKQGKTHVSKRHIDDYFAKRAADPDITEWYKASEIQAKYGLTLRSIYEYVKLKGIPKKKEGNKTFYSKKHFDIARGEVVPPEPEYYTMKEAMAKFNLTADALSHHIRRNKITKIKEGRYIKISKSELDQLFEKTIII